MAIANSFATLHSSLHRAMRSSTKTAFFLSSSVLHGGFDHLHRSPFIRTLTTKRPTILYSSFTLENPVASKEDRMEELVRDIGHGLENIGTVGPLVEALELVDLIERLGIGRFFEQQIKKIMKTTFMHWSEENGLGAAESTVLAFRLLRLHGYPVSAGVLENLRDESGEFSDFSIGTAANISGMLNLHRCWQTGFPSESKIMGEIREFSTAQLRRALLEGDPSVLQAKNLKSEILFALEYPRRYLLQRIESRSIIRQLWPSFGMKKMCLQLSRLDLAMLQKLHKEETDVLERWWEEQGISVLDFARSGVLKSYFAMSVIVFEPQFAAFRSAFTKNACLAALVDDLFDLPSLGADGLSRFTDAFLRWDDASVLDDLPEHQIIFTSLKNTVVDLATEATKAQGRDLFPYIKSLWDDALLAFIKEAEWRDARYVPSWDEYIAAARLTVSAITCMWTSVFVQGELITDAALSHVGKDSRFMHLVALVARLSNDLATFRREARDGEVASSVSAYMRDHPDCHSEEDAVTALQRMADDACHELEWELFTAKGTVPECCSRAILGFARTMAFLYKRADAFTTLGDEVYEDLVKDYMVGTLKL